MGKLKIILKIYIVVQQKRNKRKVNWVGKKICKKYSCISLFDKIEIEWYQAWCNKFIRSFEISRRIWGEDKTTTG